MSKLRFTISIPTDEGFLARECNNPDCRRYFRIHTDDATDHMFCPYCGRKFPKNELLTQAQAAHARKVGTEKVKEYAQEMLNKTLRNTLGRLPRNGLISFKVTTRPYRPRRVAPISPEPKVDSTLACHECSTRFQVDGVFGYCPKCRAEHIRIYDANLEIIRREVDAGGNSDRALRHAYSDLVSTFELLCRRRAKRISNVEGRFQNLAATETYFKTQKNVDVFASLSADERLQLRRVFQKRHLFTHGAETIDQKYISVVPEDSTLLGTSPALSLQEFEQAAEGFRKVLDAVVHIT